MQSAPTPNHRRLDWKHPMADEIPTTNPAEEWRPVKGWPYEVSSLGRIRRTGKARGAVAGKILAPPQMPHGYLKVTMTCGPRKRFDYIHRLVCAAFHGAPPSIAHRALHRDGTRTNNCVNNIRWGTQHMNMQDAIEHDRTTRGTRNAQAKLAPESVRTIRILLAEKISRRQIARRFNVSRHAIAHIARRSTWAWLD